MTRCVFILADDPKRFRCAVCGYVTPRYSHDPDPASIRRNCGSKARQPEHGPGTEFMELVHELELPVPDCNGCILLRREMDRLGPGGCRENREELVRRLRENVGAFNWQERLAIFAKAAYTSVRTGLVLKLDLRDPIGSLFDEAVKRSELKMVR